MFYPKPAKPGDVFIKPFLGSGFTSNGLYAQFDDRLPPVLGRVTAVHDTVEVCKPEDVIIFRANTPDETPWSEGVIWSLHESQVVAVLEGYDDVD